MAAREPIIWLLLGPRAGDNNQALALGEALGLPFEVKSLAYNWLARFSLQLPATVASLTRKAKAGLAPPWPELVVSVGRRSVPAARWIRRRSGGRTKIVRIGHPRHQTDLFDLILTTRQYPVPHGGNEVLLPVTMSRFVPPPPPSPNEQRWIDALPRPIRLVAVGGPTKYWRLDADPILRSMMIEAGTAVAVTSRRTPGALVDALRSAVAANNRARLVEGGFPSFSAFLGEADEIYVTGDSLSMLSEAIQAGKPVAIIPIERDRRGVAKLGDTPAGSGPRRDLRRFWDYLIGEGLAGTSESGAKRAPSVPNSAREAAAAVLKLLGRG